MHAGFKSEDSLKIRFDGEFSINLRTARRSGIGVGPRNSASVAALWHGYEFLRSSLIVTLMMTFVSSLTCRPTPTRAWNRIAASSRRIPSSTEKITSEVNVDDRILRTFDDSPHAKHAKLLRWQRRGRSNSPCAWRMRRAEPGRSAGGRGRTVGNHSWSHPNPETLGRECSKPASTQDIVKTAGKTEVDASPYGG